MSGRRLTVVSAVAIGYIDQHVHGLHRAHGWLVNAIEGVRGRLRYRNCMCAGIPGVACRSCLMRPACSGV